MSHKIVGVERKKSADVWDWPLNRNDGVVCLANDATRFEADFDIPTFRASEVDVKVVNNELVVRCHQQEQGTGGTPRQIHRTYKLPPDLDYNTVKSTVRTDGKLQIVASKKRFALFKR